jgi:hypothetical protein
MKQTQTHMPAIVLVALLAGTGAAAAQAQKLLPGLWEHQAQIKTGNGEMEAAMARMQQQLAALTPEQRKQMEAAMGGRGIAMGTAPGQPMTIKVCLTPEQAARDEIPQQQGECKQTSQSRSGNTLKFTVACSGVRKATGEGEITFVSPREHTGHMTLSSTRKGRDETMEINHHARWLAADCGTVKPRP